MSMRVSIRFSLAAVLMIALWGNLSATADGRILLQRGPADAGMVNLPYVMQDNAGNAWMIQNGGWFQQQGNQPVFGQSAMILINGSPTQTYERQCKLDQKTGELILSLNIGGFPVTRRILINREENCIRYIDIIKNLNPQNVSPTVTIQSNFNWGIQTSQMIPDPRKKDQNIAWVGQTESGACGLEIFSGKNPKLVPTIINNIQNNNQLSGQYQVTIPAGKEVAIMHLHMIVPSMDAAGKFVTDLKESKLLRTLSPDVRKLLVNFSTGQNLFGNYELLRGDVFDIVELRGDDRIKGAVQESSFKLETLYGPVEFPADQVVGLLNTGEAQSRQLLALADGQIFSGRLQKEALQFQLSSGQVTRIPLDRITRAGYRKRPSDSAERDFETLFLRLRGGDCLKVQMPASSIPVITRCGTLQLKPETIAALNFQSEESGVHEIRLTDGSRLAGLVGTDRLEMKLANLPDRTISIPTESIGRLQLSAEPAEPDKFLPTLVLSNRKTPAGAATCPASQPGFAPTGKDVLVGSLQGQLTLDTAFDAIVLNAPEIKRLAHSEDSAMDVRVTLWDDSTLSGRLRQTEVDCLLDCGQMIKAPVALIAEYNQPQPLPSPPVMERIKGLVVDLNADDCKQRDQAEAQLVAMGSAVVGVLKQMRPTQPLEAQQRIDSVVTQLQKKPDKAPVAPPARNMMLRMQFGG